MNQRKLKIKGNKEYIKIRKQSYRNIEKCRFRTWAANSHHMNKYNQLFVMYLAQYYKVPFET